MTTIKRQLLLDGIQNHHSVIDITILKITGLVKIQQGDDVLIIPIKNMQEFIREMNEVEQWSTSQ